MRNTLLDYDVSVVDNRDFTKIAKKTALELFAQLGFKFEGKCAFGRQRGQLWDGFGFIVDRSTTKFCVAVGIDIPVLWPRSDFINQGHYPTGLLSHRLGQFRRSDFAHVDTWYFFESADDLRGAVHSVYKDFVAQALPWLERFQSIADVAAEFYKWRIEETKARRKAHGPRPSDPFGWAEYGWLLEEMGRISESQVWLRKAYDEVTKPFFIDKHGRLVSEGTTGAQLGRHSEPEERLEELIRQSLRLPLSSSNLTALITSSAAAVERTLRRRQSAAASRTKARARSE